MCLFYASTSRDEEIYEDPIAFRSDRWPNRHLGFGIGEHVCMGVQLARLEPQILFAKLFERLEHVEPAGALERQRSSFVGGIKRMPVRLRLTARAPAGAGSVGEIRARRRSHLPRDTP
jgi:cytochrome P450